MPWNSFVSCAYVGDGYAFAKIECFSSALNPITISLINSQFYEKIPLNCRITFPVVRHSNTEIAWTADSFTPHSSEA